MLIILRAFGVIAPAVIFLNDFKRQTGFGRAQPVSAVPAFAQCKNADGRAAVTFFFMRGKTAFADGAAIGFGCETKAVSVYEY